jgi:squalene-associated FAD-dependent desaturase
MKSAETIVIGAGWAGLATAVSLSSGGIPVKLYESARQIGGRARRVPFENQTIDNGQHLLIGAYRKTLAMMQTTGVNIDHVLLRQPLQLISRYPDGNTVAFKAPRLPAPLHLLWSLLTAQGLSTKDRWQATRLGLKLKLGRIALEKDITVSELLRQQQQPASLCTALWHPLCLAIMNTHPDEASAEVFLHVLSDTFLYHRQDSDLLFARMDLSSIFPDPAVNYLEQQGGQVHLGQRVTGLEIHNRRLIGIWCNDQLLPAEQVVLAIPPHAIIPLLEPHAEFAPLTTTLQQIEYEPICTIYLQYPESVRLPLPMLGLLDTVGQWAFDRRFCGQAGLIAVVISAHGPHMNWPKPKLIDVIGSELACLFPTWPQPHNVQVIREKRATFACRVNINQHRPANRTTVDGLWLAGDFTATGYPATLEGAIRSGVQCAQQIAELLN